MELRERNGKASDKANSGNVIATAHVYGEYVNQVYVNNDNLKAISRTVSKSYPNTSRRQQNGCTLDQSKRKENIIEYSGNKSSENRRIQQEKLIGIKTDTHQVFRLEDAKLVMKFYV